MAYRRGPRRGAEALTVLRLRVPERGAGAVACGRRGSRRAPLPRRRRLRRSDRTGPERRRATCSELVRRLRFGRGLGNRFGDRFGDRLASLRTRRFPCRRSFRSRRRLHVAGASSARREAPSRGEHERRRRAAGTGRLACAPRSRRARRATPGVASTGSAASRSRAAPHPGARRDAGTATRSRNDHFGPELMTGRSSPAWPTPARTCVPSRSRRPVGPVPDILLTVVGGRRRRMRATIPGQTVPELRKARARSGLCASSKSTELGLETRARRTGGELATARAGRRRARPRRRDRPASATRQRRRCLELADPRGDRERTAA